MATRRKRRRPFGAGTYVKRGHRHIIQWWDVNGKRQTKSLPDEDTAKRLLAEITANVAKGLYGLVEVKSSVDGSTLSVHATRWLTTRVEHESHYDDVRRWENHWRPLIGHLTPNEVDVTVLKSGMLALRRKGLAKSSIKLCMALLSSLYSDLVEEGSAKLNPTRLLARKTRREFMKSDHDPKKVPFLRDPSDIVRVYEHLRPLNVSVAVAYVIGALGGLRTSELRALDWSSIDLEARTIAVREQAQRRKGKAPERLTLDGKAPVKDGEIRMVPIQDALYPILVEQRERVGGTGLVCPPIMGMRGKSAAGPRRRFLGEHKMNQMLGEALAALGIEEMIWYQATRHTFASQWVLYGGSLEKLQEIMGHSSVMVTERYAHLMPGRFTDADRSRMAIELRAPKAPASPAGKFLEN
jgi:integrase